MDAANVFRHHGFASVIPRPPQQHFFAQRHPVPPLQARDADDADSPHRIAHTLTACCRCRTRKTRCDPTLPRCQPCERSGSTCEYYDTARNQKINRSYVVNLQEQVRKLEAELKQLTEDGNEHNDGAGLVVLSQSNETPRYLGYSSGIAMTRLLMEEAKRYTESRRISDLVPKVRSRRNERANRMQSVVSTSASISGPSGRKKSYPMISEHPAQELPKDEMTDRLVEIYIQRGQLFTPTLHEPTLLADVEAVRAGDKDPYKNFVVRMVTAIALGKLGLQYAGLADGYYKWALQLFEDVVRPRDLKTLQCLILISQYSLLTPTATAVYYIIGYATRICLEMGLTEEKTIGLGISDPKTLDMRRRIAWIAATNEYGLAHIMGRPNGFGKTDDAIDLNFFDTSEDKNITSEGILPGPVSERKVLAIHFCKMRLLQAEIRRVLYEKKRNEPSSENHPWFAQMMQKADDWLASAPEKPEWARYWFKGRYYSMIVMMYRPNPQVPKPSSASALKCFDAGSFIIELSSMQVRKGAIDFTWVFLLTIYLSLNALLWAVSYPEVRARHPREKLEELVDLAIDIIRQCSERWPGSENAEELYTVLAKASLQSYEMKEESPAPPSDSDGSFSTPRSLTDPSSPDSGSITTVSSSQQAQSQESIIFNSQPFGYMFGSTAEDLSSQFPFDGGPTHFSGQPSFRSNSIFHNPGTDEFGRRPSYFPPDYPQFHDTPLSDHTDDTTPPGTASSQHGLTTPTATPMAVNALPTPPESLAPPPSDRISHSLSPQLAESGLKTASPTPTPTMSHASPVPLPLQTSPMPPPTMKFETPGFSHSMKPPPGMPPPRSTAFTIPPPPQQNAQQRHLPTMAMHNWHNPPPPLISPHNFSNNFNTNLWGERAANTTPFTAVGMNNADGYTIGGRENAGLGLDDEFGMFPAFPGEYRYSQQRHGSLSQDQQMELLSVLETEGMNDIDSLLSAGMGIGGPIDGGLRWS